MPSVGELMRTAARRDHQARRAGLPTVLRSGQRLALIGLLEAARMASPRSTSVVEAFLDTDLVGEDRLQLVAELGADLR